MVGCLGKMVGWVLILGSLYGALMVIAFGSSIDPGLSETQWWMEYGNRIWKDLIVCLALMFVGACLRFGPPNRWKWKRWTLIEEPEHFLYSERQKSI
jgi:hypothetical protein